MIIDAHLHLPVISERGAYGRAKQQLLEDLKKDHVDYAILIPDNIPGSAIGDVPACLRLVQDESELFLMGTMDVQTQGGPWIEELAELMSKHRIVGMKIFPGHDPVYPTDRRLEPVYELCQVRGVPVVIHTGWNPGHPEAAQYNDPKYIIQVAEQFPALKIVIAHLFWPEVDYCFEMTSGCPRIYYDTSGLADREVIEATGADRIQNVLLRLLEINPKRVVFGSDYAMCDRGAHIDLVKRLPIEDGIRENIFWRNAAELYNLQVRSG